MDERKRREKKPNPSPAYDLVLHKTINDPAILDQFTVSYTLSKKYTQRELIMGLYIYEDRLEITRNIPLGDSCVEFDTISFDELDSIQIKRYGFYNEWDGLFITGQFVPGIMMLLPMQGTKYSMYAASEYETKRPVPIKPSPIEIWFDMKYNDLIREHNPVIQKIFRDYKRKQKEEKNINPDIYAVSYTHLTLPTILRV